MLVCGGCFDEGDLVFAPGVQEVGREVVEVAVFVASDEEDLFALALVVVVVKHFW